MRLHKTIMLIILISNVRCLFSATARFSDFSGGLNDTTPSFYLKDNESPNLKNVLIDEEPGAVIKRKGSSRVGTLPTGSTATFVANYRKSDASEYFAVRSSATLYLTRDFSTYTEVRDKLNPNFNLSCNVIYDELWCVDGSTWAFKVYTSSSEYLDGSPLGEAVVPIAPYIAFDKGIVFVAKSTSSKSSVFLSRLTNDLGYIVRPDSNTAWLSENNLLVSPEDGDEIYALKMYRGSVYLFKSKSIFRISGDEEASFIVDKIVGNVGSRWNHAIIEDDLGLLNFIGEDGIYQFDGVNLKRISDKIKNVFSTINQPRIQQIIKTWDSKTDFDNGSFLIDATSSRTGGNLEILGNKFFDGFDDGDFSTSPSWVLLVGTMNVLASSITIGSNFGNNQNVISFSTGPVLISTGTWQFDIQFPTTTISSGHIAETYIAFMSNNSNAYYVQFSNASTGLTARLARATNFGSWNDTCVNLAETIISAFSINRDTTTHTVKVERTSEITFNLYIDGALKGNGTNSFFTKAGSMSICMESNGPNTVQADFPYLDNFRIPVASAVYRSEVYDTGGNIESWGLFSSNRFLGTNNIDYFFRSSADSSLNSASWVSIIPGVQITTSTNNRYFQWMATMTQVNPTILTQPSIDNVSVSWNQAGVSNKEPNGILWKNRIWFTASTGTTKENNLIMVRSKFDPTVWTKFEGLNIRAFGKFQDNLYGIHSSSGVILQLDTGDNDNGAGIGAYIDTRDEMFGAPTYKKQITEVVIDADSTGDFNLVVSVSSNSGVSFSSGTASLSGKGRVIKRVFPKPSNAHQYIIRMGNDNAGEDIRLYGVEIDANVLTYRD